MRPANIVTSVADVLAGIAISGYFLGDNWQVVPVALLSLSTIGLYGGGIVFNDIFDADLDKIERPERAIPSGAINIREAVVFGIFLLMIGLIAALTFSIWSGAIAFLILSFALIYDRFGKHHSFLGPLNMGLCRGLNLLLGMSILISVVEKWYFLGIVPLIYIFSVTLISRGEVHGIKKRNLYIGGLLYLIVIGAVLYYSFIQQQFMLTLAFVITFAIMIFRPLFTAIAEPIGLNIGKAVKAGVISLILMNAAWAATSGSWYVALLIACLLPLSLWLARRFAVT